MASSMAVTGLGLSCSRPSPARAIILRSQPKQLTCVCSSIQFGSVRSFFSYGLHFRRQAWPALSAVDSGLDVSITEPQELTLNDVNVVVEFLDDDKIELRVDLTGEQTQKAFDVVVSKLAKTAPPVPGFRRQKGGKTSNVPKSFLLQILGRERVTKFVIQEILSSTVADYVKKENLKVKNTVKTSQDAEELKSAFSPGNTFGFNAMVEFESENVTENLNS